jgi:hypothetical protein
MPRYRGIPLSMRLVVGVVAALAPMPHSADVPRLKIVVVEVRDSQHDL